MTTSIKKLIFGSFGRKSSPATRQPRASRRRQFCVLEGLEERVLQAGSPTVFMVNNTSNSAAVRHSLPWAVGKADANTNTAGSLIEFKANVFKASTPRTITLASTLALLETKGPLVIDGPGASIVTISGNNAVEVFSVATGVTASLSGLTISGGSSTNTNEGGGGIYNVGTLTVTSSTIEHNSADQGGGIANVGTLTVTNSTIEHNSAFAGGGIYNVGTLAVTNSTIEFNTVTGGNGGGGIFNVGTLTVTGSIIESNSAGGFGGGGIFNYGNGYVSGTLTVTNSTIESNTATEDGGGILNAGTVTVFESTIAGNSAVEGSGINTDGGTLRVNGSTIANNRQALDGGGIQISGGTVLLVNSTLADNSASRFGGGIAILNGGRPSNGASLLAVNCTVAYNSVSYAGAGGGLYVDTGATTTLENTIVADNFVPLHINPLIIIIGPINNSSANDIVLAAGANNVSGFYNLIGSGGSGGLTNGIGRNQVGVNPRLGPLANNGGPTQTMALLAGSPAIDAGSIFLAAYAGLTTDQRGTGFPRTHNLTVDIGAFEVQPVIVIHPPGGPILHPVRR